ncbi:MAG: hypothetical protein DRO88_01530 [Promethearchaeia archaeon]|nr:MAG: hypothetical protein DRO88_01530 [Candidatus Lokiarchaeia archaeon]
MFFLHGGKNMKFLQKNKKFREPSSPFFVKQYGLLIKNNKIQKPGFTLIKKRKAVSAPLIELKQNRLDLFGQIWDITNAKEDDIESILLDFYKSLTNSGKYYPGRYGDWLQCTIISNNGENELRALKLDFIGQLAWIKPTLAADLGIFIKSGARHYFVGIVRKNPPGQGAPAIIGGILNTSEMLDSPIYTMLREVREESNLSITYEGNLESLRENYSIPEIPVKVHGFERISKDLSEISSNIYYITTIPTTEQERNADGTKRVYMTTAYALYLDLTQYKMDEKSLKKIFQAGDDAQDMAIFDVTKAIIKGKPAEEDLPPFGLKHHKDLLRKMIEFYLHLLK